MGWEIYGENEGISDADIDVMKETIKYSGREFDVSTQGGKKGREWISSSKSYSATLHSIPGYVVVTEEIYNGNELLARRERFVIDRSRWPGPLWTGSS